jgi:hypothetical protein
MVSYFIFFNEKTRYIFLQQTFKGGLLAAAPVFTYRLGYSYITIFKRANKAKLAARLFTDATIDDIEFGKCATIKFKTDKPILDYTKGVIRRNEGFNLRTTLLFKTSKFPDYFSGDFGKVGCIYIDEKPFGNDDFLLVSFSAATTAMSILFQNSRSIKQWFISLSVELNAITTFIDLEDNGLNFLYKKGEEVNVVFDDYTEVTATNYDFYKKIFEEYKNSTDIN